MVYTSGKNIDLKKYKRFFVFGCSFTNYLWPTWADILRQEMPSETQYFNYGKSGAGQLYILSTLSQAILHHNIGEDDLVAVMWSTFYREDRYMWNGSVGSHNWQTPGNLFSQNEYSPRFVSDYCCTRGMYVRDLALIHSGMALLNNAEFDSFAIMSVTPEFQNLCTIVPENKDLFPPTEDLIKQYRVLSDYMMPDLFSMEFPNGWENSYYYKLSESDQEEIGDYHPSVLRYFSYLQKLDFVLSNQTKIWAGEQHVEASNKKYKSQMYMGNDTRILF